jgi:isocitrate dehydrogenase
MNTDDSSDKRNSRGNPRRAREIGSRDDYQSRIRGDGRRVQGEGFPLKCEVTMRHTITLIPGDGIGLEVSQAVQEILAAAGVDILWDVIPARAEIERRGQDFMQAGVLESIRKNRVALKGPLATASVGGPPSINVGLRIRKIFMQVSSIRWFRAWWRV